MQFGKFPGFFEIRYGPPGAPSEETLHATVNMANWRLLGRGAKIGRMVDSMRKSQASAPLILVALVIAFPCRDDSSAGDRQGDKPPARRPTADLFNGRDLAGWVAVGNQAAADWDVDSACIVCKGNGHTWLRTAREYDDFHLSLEYQVSPGANSGIYVRVGADGNHHRENEHAPPAGFEVQILDDRAPRYVGLKDYQYSASLYDIAGAKPHVSKQAGAWNTLEIDCVGAHVTIRHNGVRVVDAQPDGYPLLKLRNRRGFLGLQSHNGVVRFRNLCIGPPEK
jgi:hypothetical protein